MTSEDVRKMIWDMTVELRGAVSSDNFQISALRLLFLKYVIDNRIGAERHGDEKHYEAAEEIFTETDSWNAAYSLKRIMECIDEKYGFDEILSSDENISEYASLLFGENLQLRRARAMDGKAFGDIRRHVNSLQLRETDGQLGKKIAEETVNSLYLKNWNGFVRDYITEEMVVELAGRILGLGPGDSFSDFMAGTGLSTFKLVKDRKVSGIANADNNRRVLSSAVMLYILYGFENLHVVGRDSINNEIPELVGNKIFIDPPFNYRIINREGRNVDGTRAAIEKIADYYLKGNGATAVVAVSPKFVSLESGNRTRKKVVDLRMLKAVVSLTSLKRNLLVLSNEHTDKVAFIKADISEEECLSHRERLDYLTGHITDRISYPSDEDGFCAAVGFEEIEENGYNLNPLQYIKEKKSVSDRTLGQVDEELSRLYEKLNELRP